MNYNLEAKLYHYTNMRGSFSSILCLQVKLHLFKVAKLDACIRPLFINPVAHYILFLPRFPMMTIYYWVQWTCTVKLIALIRLVEALENAIQLHCWLMIETWEWRHTHKNFLSGVLQNSWSGASCETNDRRNKNVVYHAQFLFVTFVQSFTMYIVLFCTWMYISAYILHFYTCWFP